MSHATALDKGTHLTAKEGHRGGHVTMRATGPLIGCVTQKPAPLERRRVKPRGGLESATPSVTQSTLNPSPRRGPYAPRADHIGLGTKKRMSLRPSFPEAHWGAGVSSPCSSRVCESRSPDSQRGTRAPETQQERRSAVTLSAACSVWAACARRAPQERSCRAAGLD